MTSARVGSIIHSGSHSAQNTTAAAAAAAGHAASALDLKSGDPEQQSQREPHARFEVRVTTATPLPPGMRKALGAASATEAAPTGKIGGDEAGAQRTLAAGASENEAGGKKSERGSYVLSCDYILQATGAAREGHGWAKGLGHAVSAPVPSLFTLTVKDPRSVQ